MKGEAAGEEETEEARAGVWMEAETAETMGSRRIGTPTSDLKAGEREVAEVAERSVEKTAEAAARMCRGRRRRRSQCRLYTAGGTLCVRPG